MDWRFEFPQVCKKQVVIKLNRFNIGKLDKIANDIRITRSKSRENKITNWVRILKGYYKDDIGYVDLINQSSGKIYVKLLPRIDYTSLSSDFEMVKNKTSKRRPPPRAFNVDEIRKNGGEVHFKTNFLMWNNCRFSSSGFLHKYFPQCELQIEGVMPTPTEMKRFKDCLATECKESLQDNVPNDNMEMPTTKSDEPIEPVVETKNDCNTIRVTRSKKRPYLKDDSSHVDKRIQQKSTNSQNKDETHPMKRVKETDFSIINSGMIHALNAGAENPNKRMRMDEKKKKVGRAQSLRKSQLALVTPPDLSKNAICWVKIRGYKDWPGVLEEEINGNYRVHFFGDYTRSVVKKNKITNFYEGFSLFKHTFDNPKLNKAIKEACICLMNDPEPQNCLVCSISECKSINV